MLGAIIGDIIGSPYEFDCNNIKTKDFPLFCKKSSVTDDTVMTLAVGEALMNTHSASDNIVEAEIIEAMRKYGEIYPEMCYGDNFKEWLLSKNPKPYGSFGNGSAMRVSAVGWLFNDMKAVLHCAELSAKVTHNHPEGIKGAQSVASAIFLARNGHSKQEIKSYIIKQFEYDLSKTCDEIRPDYCHTESCQETVPQAITAFLESESFEDAIRLAVSLGGDSDTLTAITGSIAEAYYGICTEIAVKAIKRLDKRMKSVLGRFLMFRLTQYTDYFKKNGYEKKAYYGKTFDEFFNIFCTLEICLPVPRCPKDVSLENVEIDEVLGMIDRYFHIAGFAGGAYNYAMKTNGFYCCLKRLKELL